MYDSVLILLPSYGHHDWFNKVFRILNNISFDTLAYCNVYKCYRILTGQSRKGIRRNWQHLVQKTQDGDKKNQQHRMFWSPLYVNKLT